MLRTRVARARATWVQCAFDGRNIRPRRARQDVANYQPDLRAVTFHPNRLRLVRRPFWQEPNPAQVNWREHPASGATANAFAPAWAVDFYRRTLQSSCLLRFPKKLEAARPLHVYRGFEALVDAVGEIGRGNRRYELNDLFFIEVLAESLDILLVNPARIPGQFFREVDGRLLLRIEHRTLPAGWIFQCCDLLFADALPPRRSGMCARSIGASIENRRAQIRNFLRDRRQLTLAPDFLIKVQKCLQYFRLISQHLEKIDYLPTF